MAAGIDRERDDEMAEEAAAPASRPTVPGGPPRAVAARDTVATAVRRMPRQVGLAWGFLLINTLGFNEPTPIFPFPKAFGQVVTMGLLLAAFGIALVLNPRVRIQPSFYLVLLTLLAVLATASGLRLESGVGSLLRCFRLLVLVATLWLLSVWWRDAMHVARFHLRAIAGVLSTVLAGLLISPGAAFSGPDGRLVGALWPIPSTQVGMYCSICVGLSVLLWLYKSLDGRSALLISVPAAVMLLLSHTRTALLGLLVALALAAVSAMFTNGHVRRFLAVTLGFGLVVGVFFGAGVQTWLARGQDSAQLTGLTGRSNVWDALLSQYRTPDELLIGVGLTDKSYGGLPVDSAWLSVYNELGWAGVAIVVCILAGLLLIAAMRPPSAQRPCAIFLIVYSCVASYTEVGLGDASPYLLNLCVAAALVAMPAVTNRAVRGQVVP